MEPKVIYINKRPFFIAPDAYGVPALWRGLPTDLHPLCEVTREDAGEVAWFLISRNFD